MSYGCSFHYSKETAVCRFWMFRSSFTKQYTEINIVSFILPVSLRFCMFTQSYQEASVSSTSAYKTRNSAYITYIAAVCPMTDFSDSFNGTVSAPGLKAIGLRNGSGLASLHSRAITPAQFVSPAKPAVLLIRAAKPAHTAGTICSHG
jgi:hypothetical protein